MYLTTSFPKVRVELGGCDIGHGIGLSEGGWVSVIGWGWVDVIRDTGLGLGGWWWVGLSESRGVSFDGVGWMGFGTRDWVWVPKL